MLCSQCQRVAARAAPRSSSTLRQSLSTFSKATATRQQSTFSQLLSSPTPQRATQPTVSCSASFASLRRTYSSTTESTPAKPDYLDAAESQIWDKLAAEFSPSELSVKDVSGGCGSMYGIEITSEKFRGTTMLKQQRMVNAVLGEQIKGWHGVQLRTKVPKA